MRGYGVVLSEHLEAVVEGIRKRTDRSITEVFILALENLALSTGLVDRVEDIYMRKPDAKSAGQQKGESSCQRNDHL